MSRPQSAESRASVEVSRTSKELQREHEVTRLSRWWVLETGTVYRKKQDDEDLETDAYEDTKTTKLPFLVLHPYSKYRIGWDLLIMLLLLENFIMVPFVLCFEEPQPDKRWSTANNVSTYFHLASDCTFMVDIVFNFFTSYPKIDEKGEEVMVTHRGKIAWKYFSTWFPLDLLGSVPVEFILTAAGLLDSEESSLTRFLKFFKLMRLIKLARIWRFERFIRKLREAFDFNPAIIRAVKMGAFFCLLAHALSCLLFWIGIGWVEDFQTCKNETEADAHSGGCFCITGKDAENDPLKQCSGETWVTENYFMVPDRGSQAVVDLRIGDQYTITLYWIMSTMTTVGFGDLKPYTTFEIWTCILAQILGATTFGFIVGNMASLAELLRGRAGAFKEKMEFLVRFMNHCNIPNEVQRRVVGDLKHQMLRPVSLVKKDIIDKVPTALAIDLAKSTYQDMLEVCPLLDGVSPTTRSSLYLSLRPVHVAPGEYVVRKGDLSTSIIFILSGGLHIVSDDDAPTAAASPHRRKWSQRLSQRFASKKSLASLFGLEDQNDHSQKGILATLFPGNFVGEQCLLPGQDTFHFSVRSLEWSDLLYLDLRDMVKDIGSEEEMLYVRLAARFRSQRMTALVEASQRLSARSAAPSASMRKQVKQESPGAGSPPGGASLLNFGIPRMASAEKRSVFTPLSAVRSTAGSAHAPRVDLVKRVEELEMDVEKKQLLRPLLLRSQATGATPKWAELLGKSMVEDELKMLQAAHGSLGLAQQRVAPDMAETLMTLEGLGTRDEDGKPSQEKIEDRLHAILRRLQMLESATAKDLALVQPPVRDRPDGLAGPGSDKTDPLTSKTASETQSDAAAMAAAAARFAIPGAAQDSKDKARAAEIPLLAALPEDSSRDLLGAPIDVDSPSVQST